MAAALGTFSTRDFTKPRRVEGHTSNVESPILYSQYGKLIVGETIEAGDTYIIPHKFPTLIHINATPVTSIAGVEALYGDISDSTDGAWFADSGIAVAWTQLTTAATAGATTLTITGGSAIADVYNGCWLDIRFASGNMQTVQITDYAVTTTIATLAEGLAEAIGTTLSYYRIRGTVMTVASSCVTPSINVEVIGTFEG